MEEVVRIVDNNCVLVCVAVRIEMAVKAEEEVASGNYGGVSSD